METERADGQPISARTVSFAVDAILFILSWTLYIVVWKQAYQMLAQGVLVLLALWRFRTIRRVAPGFLSCVIPMLAFYSYVALSGLWVKYPEYVENNYFIPSGIPMPLMIPVMASWMAHYGIRRVALMWTILFELMIFTVVYSLLVLGETSGEKAGSLRTAVGEGLAVCVPFVVWLNWLRPNWFLKASVVVGGVSVLALGSRSTLITYPLVVLLSLLLLGSKNRPPRFTAAMRSVIVAGCVVVSLFLFLWLSGQSTATRMVESGTTVFDYSQSTVAQVVAPESQKEVDWDRRLMTYTAINAFLDEPIFGVGYQGILGVMAHEYGVPIVAHGFMAQILAELGLVGAALFIWVVARTYRSIWAWKADRFNLVATVAFSALLMHGFFHQVHDNWLFHALLGMSLVLPSQQGRRVVVDPDMLLTHLG
jgi:hypothetical protein